MPTPGSWPLLAGVVALAAAPQPTDGPRRAIPTPRAFLMSEVGIRIEAPPSLDDGTRFGISVAIDDDRLFVGCDGVRDGPPLPGRVLVYQRDRDGLWRWTESIVSPEAVAGDEFGATLCLDGDRLLIGAPGTDAHRGAAWCLELGRTSDIDAVPRRIPIPDAIPGDRFGESLVVRNDLVAVGAPRADVDEFLDRGRVVTARITAEGPVLAGEPVPSDARTGLRFGWSLAIDSVLHVGAPGADAPDGYSGRTIDRAGAVMSFDRRPPHSWIGVLHRPVPGRLERFGTSLATGPRSSLLVGSPRALLGEVRTGVVGLSTTRSMIEIGGDADDETGLGVPLAAERRIFAAGMPGRRGRDERPEPGIRVGSIRPEALVPRFDLVLEDRSRTLISLALDREGGMLAVGSPDPAFDDGPEVAGFVHVVRLEPLLHRAQRKGLD